MLTSSRDEQDKLESFKLGIAGYIIKPVNYRELVDSIRVLDWYWTLCETPD
jgi:DNA-binding response OmpR family regulator